MLLVGSCRYWPVGFLNNVAICSSLHPAHQASSRQPELLPRALCTLKTGPGTQLYSVLVHHLSESQGIFCRKKLASIVTFSLKRTEWDISLAHSSLSTLYLQYTISQGINSCLNTNDLKQRALAWKQTGKWNAQMESLHFYLWRRT